MLQGEEDTIVHEESSHFSALHFWFLPVGYLLEGPLHTEMLAEINYDYLPL